MHTKHTKRNGFTLMEVIIYTTILSITGTILSGVLLNTTRIKSRQTAIIEVNEQLNFVLQNIQRSIMDSSLIDISNSVSTSTLVLRFKEENKNPTQFYIQDNKVYKKEASDAPQQLTDDSVIATAVNFLKVSGYSGHDSLQIDLTLSYNTDNPTAAFSRTLSSAIARVSAATFDSSLIPGSNNLYDVGLDTTKWKNLYVAGKTSFGGVEYTWPVTAGTSGQNLSTDGVGILSWATPPGYWTASGNNIYNTNSGNVGIGTTAPTSKLVVNAIDNSTLTVYKNILDADTYAYVDGTFTNTIMTNPTAGYANISNFNYLKFDPSTSFDKQVDNRYGLTVIPSTNSSTMTGSILGSYDQVQNFGSGALTTLYGQYGQAMNSGIGTVTNLRGVQAHAGQGNVNNNQASVTTNATGLYASVGNGTTNGTISNAYGIQSMGTNSGTITNSYGLYISGWTSGTRTTTPYNIYAADTGAWNYFAGNVGIGTVSPKTLLQVSTTTAIAALGSNPTLNQVALFSGGDPGTTYVNYGISLVMRPITDRGAVASIAAVNADSNKEGNAELIFSTGNGSYPSAVTERMRITATGLGVTGSVTATGGWTGTNSSAGKLGGVIQSLVCERNGVGTVANVMAYGNGSSTGKGLRMPFAGKLIGATLSGYSVTGTITVQAFLNNSAYASYQLTATGAGGDVGSTADFSASPLSFAAGDTLGWYQAVVPTTSANNYNVLYFVIYD